MNLKPWREIAVPHEDVLKGTFQQAEFAADLSRAHDGTATRRISKSVAVLSADLHHRRDALVVGFGAETPDRSKAATR